MSKKYLQILTNMFSQQIPHFEYYKVLYPNSEDLYTVFNTENSTQYYVEVLYFMKKHKLPVRTLLKIMIHNSFYLNYFLSDEKFFLFDPFFAEIKHDDILYVLQYIIDFYEKSSDIDTENNIGILYLWLRINKKFSNVNLLTTQKIEEFNTLTGAFFDHNTELDYMIYDAGDHQYNEKEWYKVEMEQKNNLKNEIQNFLLMLIN